MSYIYLITENSQIEICGSMKLTQI